MRRPLAGTAVIFDLDGTLIDTADDLGAAMNHSLTVAGLPTAPAGRVRALIGQGARAMLRRGLAEVGVQEPDEQTLDRHVETFIDYYRRNIAAASRPFPGVIELITGLKAQGAAVAVCTNKREALAVTLLEALGIAGLFSTIVGGDTAGVAKPDPRPVFLCLERSAATKGVFIGDSDTDILAAQAAGLPSLIADFGYGPLDDAAKAFSLFSSYADAEALIVKALGVEAR